ncbi:MAG: hypothetical protein MZV64_24705 [Ignavibacteriales bacterium]|nr:hypothetical protein [Ignavibacteriales bacterium]
MNSISTVEEKAILPLVHSSNNRLLSDTHLQLLAIFIVAYVGLFIVSTITHPDYKKESFPMSRKMFIKPEEERHHIIPARAWMQLTSKEYDQCNRIFIARYY